MKIIFAYLLYLFFSTGLVFGANHAQSCQTPLSNLCGYYSFDKITEGKILFDLFIPDSKETRVINIFCTSDGVQEIVFSIPIVSGNKLYPQKITSGNSHKFEIDFDLRYNYCKIFIDGKWLTSVLARKQYHFINGIKIDNPDNKNGDIISINPLTEGVLLEVKSPLKIVAFGNSTTAYRNTITGVYSQRLPDCFKKKCIPVHIFNEGVGGSHTGHLADNSLHKVKHALDRFDTAVLSKEPDIVIFSFGLNDSWVDSDNPNDKSRISLRNYRKNLLFMVRSLQKRNVAVILMTPNGLGKNKELWRHKRTGKYVEAIRGIAEKEKLPLIDQWKMFDEYASLVGKEKDDLLLDGIHPNDMWHEKLAGIISELIFKSLR